jgi:energy-coupling factor transporter transmembrane protein EcfT
MAPRVILTNFKPTSIIRSADLTLRTLNLCASVCGSFLLNFTFFSLLFFSFLFFFFFFFFLVYDTPTVPLLAFDHVYERGLIMLVELRSLFAFDC